MERQLIDLTTKELQSLKMDKLDCLNKTIKICKQMGDKNWKNNAMVKAYADKIIEIDKILNGRGV